jgi:hypothetical protein
MDEEIHEFTHKVKALPSESLGFFKYVFNFDTENKNHMLNMLQYTVLTILPVLLILRGIKHVIPEEDESKGSLEILAESVGQIILIMLAIWFTNKVIQYIPTYSGSPYPKFNETGFIIPFVLILATMQTKLGAKFNILIDRVMRYMKGQNASTASGGDVRVMQPLAGQQQMQQQGGGGMPDYMDRTQLLPNNAQLTAMPAAISTQAPRHDYSQNQPAYGSGGGQMQGGQMQGQMQGQLQMEPMAANEGGSWGTAW